jgi:hypothetical protein
LHAIGSSGEQHAPTVLDQCEAEGGREMALSAAGGPNSKMLQMFRCGAPTQRFSRTGDAGTLVVGYTPEGERVAVGLIFARERKSRSVLYISVSKHLASYDVTLVLGHHVR